MRRKGQAGNVFQKEGSKKRRKSDPWLPDKPAYLQYWEDVPGETDSRRKAVIPLGFCRTRTIAERKGAEKIEQLGINSAQRFIEVTSTITFKKQGERWLKSLSTRKRNPLEQTTIDNRRYALDKWIYPFMGDKLLADVNNRALKELVEQMSEKLSPASTRDYSSIVKAVVASAIDENGEEVFPRKWNDEYIDAPMVKDQNQPSSTGEGITKIVKEATGQYRMLYALLAGCGPLRAGEALGLEIGKHVSQDCRTLYIRQKAKRGIIQPWTKTQSGTQVQCDGEAIGRDVDLCTELAGMLRNFIGSRTSGLLFCTSTGNQLLQSNTLQDSLHPILKKIEHVKGGLNIFRRFRITKLKTSDCPEFLQHFWSGHAHTHVSERYTKLLKDRDFRLGWAENIGLGFELPTGSIGELGVLVEFQRAS